MLRFLTENGRNRSNSPQLSEILKDVFYGMGERRGDGMTAFKTAMNNYQSFLQTNKKKR
jgi:hypothetical protein